MSMTPNQLVAFGNAPDASFNGTGELLRATGTLAPAGNAGKVLSVNGAGTGIELSTPSGGSGFSLGGVASITSGTSNSVTISSFATIYGTSVTITNTNYKLYSDAGLTTLVYDTGDLAANAGFAFNNQLFAAGTFYVVGRHKISRPSIYATEISSLYLTPTAAQQIIIPPFVDNIAASLSTNLAAYTAAALGNWVKITSAEYDTLASTVLSTSRSGTLEANMLTGSFGSFSGGAMMTFGHNFNPTPSGNYIYAFKVASTSAVPGNQGDVVRVSNVSDGTGFAQLGGPLPAGLVNNSQQHFVLKGSSIAFSSGYLGASLAGPSNAIYFSATGTSGRYASGSLTTVSSLAYGWSMQALSTPTIQWVNV